MTIAHQPATRQRPWRIASEWIVVIALSGVAALIGASLLGTSSNAAAAAARSVECTSTLDDLLDELEEWLKDVDETLDSEPTAPIPETVAASVEAMLDDAEMNIDQIFDPLQSPSLSPVDAGTVDETIVPADVWEYATAVHQLALEAQNESRNANPDHEVIGSRLKTIQSLLPGLLRAMADQ